MKALLSVMHYGDDNLTNDSPQPELVAGATLIVMFFVIFLGWAALAPLDAATHASGQIAVTGNRQAVQHREGGVVAAVHVSEGDHVTKGQVLVELSAGELRATERGVSGEILALMAQRARMVAERDGLPMIHVPAEFATLSEQDKTVADEAMRLQALQFSARHQGRFTETGVLGQRVSQLEQQIKGYEVQIDANVEQRRLIGQELAGMQSLAAKGFAPENRVRALERTAAALDGDLGSLHADVARTQEAIGEARLETLGVSTKMNEEVADLLRQIEIQLNELRPKLAELRSQINQAQVRAPVSGQVVGLTVFTVGGVISPGQTLMEVVPDKAALVVVVSVNPADIDDVRIGQTGEIKFPGLQGRSIPMLHGAVSRISADSFTDEKSGRSHYRAEIVIPTTELAKLGRAANKLRPGMPAEMLISSRKRTALQYLIEPLANSLWRSGSEQ